MLMGKERSRKMRGVTKKEMHQWLSLYSLPVHFATVGIGTKSKYCERGVVDDGGLLMDQQSSIDLLVSELE
jgi:hypothetical protein